MAETPKQRPPRPLSPHLQVYNLPLLARVSISHRFTGIALFGMLMLVSAWVIALAAGPEIFGFVDGWVRSPLGLAVLILGSFALFWHGMNGVRHLFWDWGRMLSLPQAEGSALVVIFGSIAATIALWAWLLLA